MFIALTIIIILLLCLVIPDEMGALIGWALISIIVIAIAGTLFIVGAVIFA